MAKDPNDPVKRYLLARLYRELGRSQDAAREFAAADPHRATELLAAQDDRLEARLDARQLGLIFLVRVLLDREGLRVGVVAGVDTHLFDV